MSNRIETTEARIQRMQRNSQARLDAIRTLEENGIKLGSFELNKKYVAYRQNRKANRLLSRMRDTQLKAFHNHMERQNAAGSPTMEDNA